MLSLDRNGWFASNKKQDHQGNKMGSNNKETNCSFHGDPCIISAVNALENSLKKHS